MEKNILPVPVDDYIGKNEEAAYVAAGILSRAKEIEIDGEEANGEALDLLNRARSGKKSLNKIRLDLTAPLNKYVGDINTQFKIKVAPLEEADSILSKKTGDYHEEKVRRQREEEARVEKERREREAKIEHERKLEEMRAAAEAREPEEIEIPETILPEVPDAIPEVKKTTETASGAKITMREHTDVEVINEAEVPRQFCSSDIRKIREAVNNGIENIPGVKITKVYRPAQGRSE